MATSTAKTKHGRTQSQSQSQSQSPTSSSKSSSTSHSSSLSSHLAMVELKHRILASLSKLSDRDTHQIAVDDLEKIIRSLPADGFPMLLNSLLHDQPTSADPTSRQQPNTAKRECLRLLAFLCSSHPEPASAHLPKIISHVVRRIKDSSSDTSVRDACRDAIGSLSSLYLGTINDPATESYSSVVSLFVKPFFEAMGEQNKGVQAGAALCLAKVVECAPGEGDGEQRSAVVGPAFQKLLPRICKLLGGQSFLAKGALLSVVSSLSQVGAITPQSMQSLLPSIRECMESSDWVTRKAAADTLSVLASNSSHLVGEGAASTLTALEACRFDKVKPVRDSMTEALGLWKKIGGQEGDVVSEDRKSISTDGKNSGSIDPVGKLDNTDSKTTDRMIGSLAKKSSTSSSPPDGSVSEGKGNNIPEKAVVILKKKVPSLNDKDLNPEFFQNLETRSLDDLPVEVVVPHKCLQSSNSRGEGEVELKNSSSHGVSCDDEACHDLNEIRGSANFTYNNSEKRLGTQNRMQDLNDFTRDRWAEQRIFKGKDSKGRAFDSDDRVDVNQKDFSIRAGISRADAHSESSLANSKGNWLTIQRQLSQLERQQANLMNMLQDFMGGSHDSMVTLENRVRGLERVVEEMARDLAVGRRGSNMMMGFEGSPGRSSNKFNGFPEYPNSKFGRGTEGRMPFVERFLASDGMVSGMRGRDPPWRSDTESWDSYAYGAPRNGTVSSRRGLVGASVDSRLPRTEHDSDQIGNRRGWDKGSGPFRLGEGPSARSVWQASKDEATLEAIRVAGEDNGTHRTVPKKTIAELDGEALGDDNTGQDRGPLWASWTHAMDSLHAGDVDSAYAEILSTGDDLLLVKLMDRSGPVMDQLSNEIANEVLHTLGQFLLEQNLLDIALSWIQQLTELVVENGADVLGIHIDSKREILLGLHDASTVEPPEDWEGPTAEQLMVQLAAAWEINIQQLVK